MKAKAGNEKSKGGQQQKPASAAKASGRGSPAAASLATGRVIQLGRMSHAELMSLAQCNNKQLGLVGDVLAPVMRGFADAATVRPPAVHPFTVGGAPRKDEYQTAWKSLSKRIGVPLYVPIEAPFAAGATGAARTGRLANSAAVAAATAATTTAAAATAPPTHAQLYGSADQPLQQVQFAEALASWLGVGPIDLPLLAPGAPPLPLRRLFMEVLEAGGTGHAYGARGAGGSGGGGSEALSWRALAGRLQGDEELGELLRQVYDAYLLPLEQRLLRGTRPARVEAWMQEDLRRRGVLLGEQLVPTAEQVASRLKAGRAAILTLHQQQQLRGSAAPPAGPHMVAPASAASNAGGQDAAPAAVAVRATVGGAVERKTAAMAAVVVGTGSEAAGGAAGMSAAAQSPPPLPHPVGSFAAEVMQVLRVAAVAAPTLLPGVVASAGGSKRARTSSRGGRRGSKAGSRKRARGSGAAGGSAGPEGADAGRDGKAGAEVVAGTSTDPTAAAVGAAAGARGEGNGGEGDSSLVLNLTDPKASALLSVVASLRELRSGPPGCATRPPDLRTNFMVRWEELHAERAAAEAAATAAAAAAASVPAGAAAAASAVTAAARAAAGGGRTGFPPTARAAAVGAVREQEEEEEDLMDVDEAGFGGGSGVVEAQTEGEVQGKALAGAEEEEAGGGSKEGRQQQRGGRQAKRQRKPGPGSTGARLSSPPPPASDQRPPPQQQQLKRQRQQQQQPDRKSDSPRRPSQRVSSSRGQSSRKQHGREPQRPPPPSQQQRELVRSRPADEWRRSSPYPQPPLHYQAHRALPSAVPLMSAAASPHDSRSAPPLLLPPRSSHRPVPPAVQQHLEEMRRHAHARSHPYIGGGNSGSGGEFYDWPPPAGERELRGPGGAVGYGPGNPSHAYSYPRHPPGGREEGGWDEVSGRGGDRDWDYGGHRGLH